MSDWKYPGLPEDDASTNPCDGCHECAMRCTSGIQMTEGEFARIAAHLATLDPHTVMRVFDQEKRAHWFEEVWREVCLFQDISTLRCLIYPVRPLICRLFGRVEWLPCPVERPLLHYRRGLEIIQTYAGEHRATFAEWCMTHGIFDLRRLTRDSGGDSFPKLPPPR